jgi:hypothetical protein
MTLRTQINNNSLKNQDNENTIKNHSFSNGSFIICLEWEGNCTDDERKTVMVGGAPMYPSKNIIENAVNSKDHKT